MTQTTFHTTHASFLLPDIFSTALVAMFDAVQPGIVQVSVAGRGGGTGVIWHKHGRIITNNHVVASDDAKVQVLLVDGRTLEAKVLYRNPKLDLALLKVLFPLAQQQNAGDLKALQVGDSSKLRVGEWVFAIGHPWGERWVVTSGIMSGMSSVKIADDLTTHYIKSDVHLAPGNSGGPLLDADGKVVGINAMIFGGDLAVAIPSNVVSKWLSALPKRRIRLGIEIQTMQLPEHLRSTLSLKPERMSGVMVVGITAERQPDNNDLLIGDILLEIAGHPINDTTQLRQILAQSEERDTLPMHILRGGALLSIDVATHLQEQAA